MQSSTWQAYLSVCVVTCVVLLNQCTCSSVGVSENGENGIKVGGDKDALQEVRRQHHNAAWKTKRRMCLGLDDNVKEYSPTGGIQVYQDNVDDLEQTDMVCGADSQFCYALWKYTENGTMVFMKQGCWEASTKDACKTEKCISHAPKSQQIIPGKSMTTTTTTQPKQQNNKDQLEEGGEQTTIASAQQDKSSSAEQGQNQNQPKHFFCCCDTDYCNENAEVVYVEDEEMEGDSSEEMGEFGGMHGPNKRRSLPVVLILCGSILCGLLIIFVGYQYWKRLSLRYRKGREQGEDCDGGEDGMSLGGGGGEGKLLLLGGEEVDGDDRNIIDGIQLVVLLAKGKFASVYEGKIPSLADSPFALKCFNKEQKEFFENERFVFNYLGKHCNHENIIKYYGWQEFTVGPTAHLILVLDKICPGNLREYLQAVTSASDTSENESILKISDVLRICSGIASGLSYLHGENRDEIVIAHRDLTSKNILIDGETLTPKITDFGLSLVTRGSKYYWAGRERQAEFCSLAEAGTLRYMAPELLEGAVNLKDCENALKQADVYALALIIWETANCSKDVRLTRLPPAQNQTNQGSQGHQHQQQQQQGQNNHTEEVGVGGGGGIGGAAEETILTVEHSLPYEEEIGKDNLSMDLLSRHVVQYRNRPHFRKWKDTPYTRQLRDTLVESWDAEPDARLTALCIVERLIDIKNIRIKNSELPGITSSQNVQSAVQTPLESPGQSGLYGEVIDSPWTGRNPCLQRNLLTVTATSTTSGGGSGIGIMGGGMSTSGSGLSESNSLMEAHHNINHLRLNHYDFSKNQANFYHNYVGGSSGGTSYSGTSTTSAGGNNTEMSNVSSMTDDRHQGQIIETRFQPGGVGGQQGQPAGQGTSSSGPPALPPTIPFVQNLHA